MDGKSSACVDMLADDGAGGAAAPTCPVAQLFPAARGRPARDSPQWQRCSLNGSKDSLVGRLTRSSGGMPWPIKFGSRGDGPSTC